MIDFHNKKISMVRGDTNPPLQINFSREIDSAIFSVKKNINDTEYILQKQIVDGLLKFEHEDTNTLDAGDYVFDIQVVYDGEIETPLIGTFKLIADVTRE